VLYKYHILIHQNLPYKTSYFHGVQSWDSAVYMATDYWLKDQGVGVRVPVGTTSMLSRQVLGPTQPTIQWVLLTRRFAQVKWLGLEANHSPSTSAEIKKAWIYTSTPLLCLHSILFNWIKTGATLPYFHTVDNRTLPKHTMYERLHWCICLLYIFPGGLHYRFYNININIAFWESRLFGCII
jgi:hypothetical protein